MVLVALLFLLAIIDLIVGVSNDAVNFLNSAIGSKVTKVRTILILASIGILTGALLSGQMMEVARKGIFNPNLFTFQNLLYIFLAVMLTDIFLLDVFNTLGLPTSTTVSIVFELLGAAVITAYLKINFEGNSSELLDFINSEKALKIIQGILYSVGIAFAAGAIVQYVVRVIFSYNYLENSAVGIALYTGLAFSFLSYLLVVKGLKKSNFLSIDQMIYVKQNALQIIAFTATVLSVIIYILHKALKVNILKITVLFGVFTLAMAFASNDLVNFIGVPVAGFQSYQIWMNSGDSAENLLMNDLAGNVPTPFLILFGAGVVMIITLWLSKKAKNVTLTEIKLSSQNVKNERFKSNIFSNTIVRLFTIVFTAFNKLLPEKTKIWINNRFKIPAWLDKPEAPAYDLLRASVNLSVASMVIAYATNNKLPLSTTYVTFMVAMGTSLADRAWKKDTAGARVAGVINVISGWFLTALVAFFVAGLFVLTLYYLSIGGLFLILTLVSFSVYKTFRISKKQNFGD